MKKYIIILSLFIYLFAFSNVIKVVDEDKLLNIKFIEYLDENDLENKILKLNEIILEKGYITSRIVKVEDKVHVLTGKIDKVVLNDESTLFPEFKKNLFGLNLENKVFNIKDIDMIVSRYNMKESNKLTVNVEPSEKILKSDLYFNNEYKTKNRVNIKHSINLTDENLSLINGSDLTVGVYFDQLFGLNDDFSTYLKVQRTKKTLNFNYSLPIHENILNLSYTMNENKFNDRYSGYEINQLGRIKLTNSSLKINREIINIYNDFSINYNSQKILNTNIKKLLYVDDKLGLSYSKFLHTKYPIYLYLDFNLKIGSVYDLMENKKEYILSPNLDFNLNSKYYSANLNIAGVKSLTNKELVYSKYYLSNTVSSIDDMVLELPSSNIIATLNNTLKYPISTKNGFSFIPSLEVALGVTDKNYSIGAGFSVNFIFKNFNIKARYSINNINKKVLNMQINLDI